MKALKLPGNKISDIGAKALAKVLNCNTILEELNLSGNQIGSVGTEALAQAIESKTSLKKLVLCDNDVGYVGAKALAEVLNCNTILEELDLSDNEIGNVGTEALAQAIVSNMSLKKLFLSSNNVGDPGTVGLAQALHPNNGLEELYLNDNKISDQGVQALAEVLYSNFTLKHLVLTHYPWVSWSGVNFLIQALTVNTSVANDKDRNLVGLVLDERCKGYALNCSQYESVKHKIIFDVDKPSHLQQSSVSSVQNHLELEESVVYIGKACTYTSQSGICLNFPAAECQTPVKMSLKVVSGEYTLPPEGRPLVSSMFKITASDTLPIPVTVQMKHCAVPDKENSLVHVVAHDGPPYHFQPLHGGIFPPGKSYGEIQLTKFSIISIIYWLLGWRMELSVHVFYHRGSTRNTTSATFVASRNIPADIEAVEKAYSKGCIRVAKHAMLIDYTTDEIRLIIPPAQPGEWCVKPEFDPPRIKTQLILEYGAGKIPPNIHLKMKWTGEGDPADEEIKIKLEGTLDDESFTLFCSASTSASPIHNQQSGCVTMDTSPLPEHSTSHISPSQSLHGCVSVESRSLRRSCTVFTSGVDPENLVKVLYGNFLLTPEERDKALKESLTDGQKLQEIFKAMERRVSVKPIYFNTLLQALEEEPATEEVAKRMKGKICWFNTSCHDSGWKFSMANKIGQ